MQQAELGTFITNLEALLATGQKLLDQAREISGQPTPARLVPLCGRDEIRAYVKAAGSKGATQQEILTALPHLNRGTVRGDLKKLVDKHGEFELRNGFYHHVHDPEDRPEPRQRVRRTRQ